MATAYAAIDSLLWFRNKICSAANRWNQNKRNFTEGDNAAQGEHTLDMSCVKRVSKKTTALKSAHFQFESEDTKVLITSIAFITLDLSSLLEFLLNQLT